MKPCERTPSCASREIKALWNDFFLSLPMSTYNSTASDRARIPPITNPGILVFPLERIYIYKISLWVGRRRKTRSIYGYLGTDRLFKIKNLTWRRPRKKDRGYRTVNIEQQRVTHGFILWVNWIEENTPRVSWGDRTKCTTSTSCSSSVWNDLAKYPRNRINYLQIRQINRLLCSLIGVGGGVDDLMAIEMPLKNIFHWSWWCAVLK